MMKEIRTVHLLAWITVVELVCNHTGHYSLRLWILFGLYRAARAMWND